MGLRCLLRVAAPLFFAVGIECIHARKKSERQQQPRNRDVSGYYAAPGEHQIHTINY